MKRSLSILASVLLSSAALFAQGTQTAYMLDNFVYGYRFNPATTPELNFIGIPISNVFADANSSFGVSSLLYPSGNGKLVTGLNSSIASKVFLKSFSQNNGIFADVSENILSFGFKGRSGGYSTVELNARVNALASLPYDLFAFLKDDGRSSYDLSSLSAKASAYIELAYGYSRRINDMFSVGARVKFLVGAADARLQVEKGQIEMYPDKIGVTADARLLGSANFAKFGTKDSKYLPGSNDVVDFNDFSFVNNFKPSGYGAAIDLGFKAEPIEGLTVDFAIVDLGLISWNYGIRAITNADVAYTGIDNMNFDEGSIKEELNGAMDKLGGLSEFHLLEGSQPRVKMLPFTINAAAKYAMPFYNPLIFGITASYKYLNPMSWFDARACVALTPVKGFSMTANIGYATSGPTFGAALSIGGRGIGFFLSGDGYIGRLGKYGSIPFPVNRFRYALNLGITIQFGKR